VDKLSDMALWRKRRSLAQQVLHKLRADAPQSSFDSTKLDGWRIRADHAMVTFLGSGHPLVAELDDIWDQMKSKNNGFEKFSSYYHAKFTGVIDAALVDIEVATAKQAETVFLQGIDQHLRARLHHALSVEDWTGAASLTATYVEDKLRTWSGLDTDHFGTNLMTRIFKPDNGLFPLGKSMAEREGWHQLARGFAAACSNVDRHRIQKRTDLKSYTFGVIGVASLLITQMKHEHSNSFVDE
jgi:hypothetical protein